MLKENKLKLMTVALEVEPEEEEGQVDEPLIDAPRFSTINTMRDPDTNVRDFGNSLVHENLLYVEQLNKEECIRDTVRQSKKTDQRHERVFFRRGKTTRCEDA